MPEGAADPLAAAPWVAEIEHLGSAHSGEVEPLSDPVSRGGIDCRCYCSRWAPRVQGRVEPARETPAQETASPVSGASGYTLRITSQSQQQAPRLASRCTRAVARGARKSRHRSVHR